ncbi:putative Bro-N domain-containing protein 8 [Diachasmimorpha longicaudata entomopoxvirus]|uniref:Putative Bro-N domain-containing protein 8 n=1 Tax=Diachasmimorpha longicaudata entomopoxvirus TaxID=109981 RepID=A0A7R5WM41_9POXV|nr:putative Bro-N domain-containing protein 8 [Diachasmimorpha longicaudata entomopoxvirus]AKS26389.1 putative Bro-N domain-containing protein 8 [Diachasmimorpha longicaudata entomopoxvirus]
MSLSQHVCKLNNTRRQIYIFVDKQSQIWFRGKDVTRILGYKNAQDALANYVPENYKSTWEKMIYRKRIVCNLPSNWNSQLIFILEPGIYFLIARSKFPEVTKFNEWIFKKVLAIRKANVPPPISHKQYTNMLKKVSQMSLNDPPIKDKRKLKKLKKSHDTFTKLQKMDIIPQKSEEMVFRLLQHKEKQNEYYYLCRQSKYIEAATKNKNDYHMVFHINLVPKGANFIHVIKTYLKNHKVPHKLGRNTIITESDLAAIVSKL